jgi:hypothetical protein
LILINARALGPPQPAYPDSREDDMAKPIDATNVAPHGMFYMENAGGCQPEPEHPDLASPPAEAHQPSCFGLEEERGWNWKGAGASGLTIKETRPTL